MTLSEPPLLDVAFGTPSLGPKPSPPGNLLKITETTCWAFLVPDSATMNVTFPSDVPGILSSHMLLFCLEWPGKALYHPLRPSFSTPHQGSRAGSSPGLFAPGSGHHSHLAPFPHEGTAACPPTILTPPTTTAGSPRVSSGFDGFQHPLFNRRCTSSTVGRQFREGWLRGCAISVVTQGLHGHTFCGHQNLFPSRKKAVDLRPKIKHSSVGQAAPVFALGTA